MDFLWKENGWKFNYFGFLVFKICNGYVVFLDKVIVVSNLLKKKIILVIVYMFFIKVLNDRILINF